MTVIKRYDSFTLMITGTCQPDEFAKALEKIGVLINSKRDLDMLFQYYDTDGSGALDYKEFSVMITGAGKDTSGVMEKKNQQYGSGFGYKA
jgi:Ca2+-binding EF-hand superfamily protein